MTEPLNLALIEEHLQYVAETLRAADGAQFLPPIEAALQDIAAWRQGTLSLEEAGTRVRRHYKSLFWGGHGDFSEFFVMQSTLESRQISNADLTWSKDMLWTLLG